MNTKEYLDLAKKNKGIVSDSKLASALGWGRQKISNYRNEKQQMDNEAAREFAEFLGVPVLQVIADMEAQRQKDPRKKKAWKMLAKLSKQSGRATANLLITLPFLVYGGLTLYIMLNSRYSNNASKRCERLPLAA